jgi:hypothetical protein
MAVYTLHFCGTDCWPTEGEVEKPGIKIEYFNDESRYIPVRLYQKVKDKNFSFVIPGPGNPWGALYNNLLMPCSINDRAAIDMVKGNSMIDLAGHAVACCVGARSSGRNHSTEHQFLLPTQELCNNLNAKLGSNFTISKPTTGHCWWSDYSLEHLFQHLNNDNTNRKVEKVNIIGHSRGGITAIMASHDIHRIFPKAEINIFAIDPVPGSGTLTTEMTTLSNGVKNYVGVYAIDERSVGFNAVVPRYREPGGNWIDPLKRVLHRNDPKENVPTHTDGIYRLIYAPGRHGTVSGLSTTDGQSLPNSRISGIIGNVPALVSRLSEYYFKQWGSELDTINDRFFGVTSKTMIDEIKENAELFRAMRNFYYLGALDFNHLKERGVTSSSARSPSDWEYLEDSIGLDPPLINRTFRLTATRPRPGRHPWEALQDLTTDQFPRRLGQR